MSNKKFEPTMPSTTKALPSGTNSPWRVAINGEDITSEVNILHIDNTRFGTLTFGLTQAGYPGWTFHEPGGGGSVLVPFTFLQGKLFIGVLWENRPHQNLKKEVQNLPRVFMDRDENHFQAAANALANEVGIDTKDRITNLRGEPGNPNSAFFETNGKGEGVKYYSFELLPHELDLSGPKPTISSKILNAVSDSAQKVMKCKFYTFQEIATPGDLFTPSGATRLVAYLQTAGRLPHF